ncbi:MAG: hypothetical protein Kow002_06500 [Anaerolineales bacterium]
MKKNRIFLFLGVLVLSTLACSVFIGGPDYPDVQIPVSAEEVLSLKAHIEQAVLAGAETGLVTIQITEPQITSYLAFKMAEQEQPPFTDPQVFLRDGQMQIYGKVERGFWNANILISLTVSLDEGNQPKIEIASADFGPFEAPNGLKQTLTAIITEAYTGSLGPVATGFRLENIVIENGLMTVTGRVK